GPYAARAGAQLPDHRQGSDASDEPGESGVSQLGDSLWRARRLLHPPSPAVAEQDPRTWSAPASRAAVSATGHVAALTSTSPPRATQREPEAHHHRQTAADTIPRTIRCA